MQATQKEHMTTRLQTPFEICKSSSDFANPHPKNENPLLKNANPVFENANPKIKNANPGCKVCNNSTAVKGDVLSGKIKN